MLHNINYLINKNFIKKIRLASASTAATQEAARLKKFAIYRWVNII